MGFLQSLPAVLEALDISEEQERHFHGGEHEWAVFTSSGLPLAQAALCGHPGVRFSPWC